MKTRINDNKIDSKIKSNLADIIPVICDDMFEYFDENGRVCSLNEYMFSLLSEQYDDCDEKLFKEKNIYYAISYLENINETSVDKFLHNALSVAIENGNIRLKGVVREFLITGTFPVVITTFGFTLLEDIFRTETNKQIFSEWYSIAQRNDLPIIAKGNRIIVYHLFGGETPYSWVYNEQTLLKFMHKLHDGDYSAKNLSNYLCRNNKMLLILGSTFPDWLFRFLIYPIYEEKIGITDGYWLSLNSIDDELEFFLARNKYHGKMNLQNMNQIDSILNNAIIRNKVDGQINTSKEYKIFVSYKRDNDSVENAKILNRVIGILKKQGQVWLDVSNVADGGNPYWANIKRAIMCDCNLFVPLVTRKYIKEFTMLNDWNELKVEQCKQAEGDDANDTEVIQHLKPVVREAYYAIKAKSVRESSDTPIKFCPIVVVDGEIQNAGHVEKMIREKTGGINMPPDIFLERTMVEHDDNNPKEFNLPNIM